MSRRLRSKGARKNASNQLRLGFAAEGKRPHVWQRRFYDFNVWSYRKKVEKLTYMHLNPVKRRLVDHPKDWPWSSYSYYDGELLKIDCV